MLNVVSTTTQRKNKFKRMDTNKTVKLYELLKEVLKPEDNGYFSYSGKYDDSVVAQIINVGAKTVAYHRVKLFGKLKNEGEHISLAQATQKIEELAARVEFLERELGIKR